jgi:hypothetical protein
MSPSVVSLWCIWLHACSVPPVCTCRTVKKGLLLFAKSVLNFPLAGTFRLGHVMVVITGMALVGEWEQQ